MDGFSHLLGAAGGAWDAMTSDPAVSAIQLALAALFATAGLYKLRHPLIAATAMVNFRVLRRPTGAAGRALGAAEVLTAALLLMPWRTTALIGCLAAGLLSAGFTAVIVGALRSGERFPCNCLGGSTDDVSPVTLARALAMLIGAVAAGWKGPAEPSAASAGLAAAFVGIPLAALLTITVWRRYRRFVTETDWEWVFAVRSGQTATPEREAS